jgi:membrane-associated phospholipid phosphatase
VTANHYWIDILLGWFVAALAFTIAAKVIARLDPEAWGWSRVVSGQRLQA